MCVGSNLYTFPTSLILKQTGLKTAGQLWRWVGQVGKCSRLDLTTVQIQQDFTGVGSSDRLDLIHSLQVSYISWPVLGLCRFKFYTLLRQALNYNRQHLTHTRTCREVGRTGWEVLLAPGKWSSLVGTCPGLYCQPPDLSWCVKCCLFQFRAWLQQPSTMDPGSNPLHFKRQAWKWNRQVGKRSQHALKVPDKPGSETDWLESLADRSWSQAPPLWSDSLPTKVCLGWF